MNIMEEYYFSKEIEATFDEAIQRATESLKEEGFGVLTEIRIHDKLREKLDVDFHPYIILGACHPPSAYKALQHENKIGTMLPCNVIVQQTGDNRMEVAAINPIESMKAVENPALGEVAESVKESLKRMIDRL
jgi:uncharacterized protein (DUF302 family)